MNRSVFCLFAAAASLIAQTNGTPVAVAGWNLNDPANTADGHPAGLTHLSVLWDAIIGPDGLVVFAEASRIRRIAADGTIHTLTTDTRLTNFTKLAEDHAGNIYYTTESEIWKIATDGTTSKIAGYGSALAKDGLAAQDSLVFVQGLTFDPAGNLLFSDGLTYHVFRIDSSGILRVVAGTGTSGTAGLGGPAISAQLQYPIGLSYTVSGELLVNDAGRLLRIRTDGTMVLWNSGSAQINTFVATPDPLGNVYYAGPGEFQVRRLASDGASTLIAGTGNIGFSNGCGSAADPTSGDAKTATLDQIVSILVEPSGSLLVADRTHLRRISTDGKIRTVAGDPPSFGGDGGPAGAAFLDQPHGLAFAADGSMYIADTANHRIRKITPDGIIHTVAGQDGPTGDMTYNCSGATANSLHSPESVAVDTAGNVYIADTQNNRVMKLSPAGALTRFAGTGTGGFAIATPGEKADAVPLNSPRAVGVDGSGNVWIGDNAERTLKIAPDGTVANVLLGLRARAFGTDGKGALYLTSGLVAYQVVAGDQLVTMAGTGIGPSVPSNGAPPVEAPDTFQDTQSGSGLTLDGRGTLYNVTPAGVDVISNYCSVTPLQGNRAFLPYRVWQAASSPQGDVYLTDISGNVVWRLPSASLIAGGANAVPTPALSPGAPVQNAGSNVVTSFDMTVPTGSNSTAVIRTLQSDAAAPGELIRIYGQCIGPFQPVVASYDSSGRLPVSLGGVQVQIDGVSAPLVSVQEGMVVAVTPFGLCASVFACLQDAQTSPAVLSFNGAQLPFSVTASTARPGLFRYLEPDGSSTALALNQDGSINSQSHPAPVGSVVAFFGTGFGATVPASVDGKGATDISLRYQSEVKVTIGGAAATVQYAGVAPGFAGMTQVNVAIPQTKSGAAPVKIQMGNAPFRQTVQVWVQ